MNQQGRDSVPFFEGSAVFAKYRKLCILCLSASSIVLLFLIVLSESRRQRNSARHFGSFISATNEEGSIMLMYDDAAISTDKLH